MQTFDPGPDSFFPDPRSETRLSVDAAMTADRDERKFVLTPGHASKAAAAFAEHLPVHRYTGKGSTSLPGAHAYATTIYFDTSNWDLFERASTQSNNLKLRAREYYTWHPSLAQLATDARQLVRYSPVLWLELKYKHGVNTRKRRIGLPKANVPEFFAQGAITPEIVELQKPLYGGDTAEVLDEVVRVCRQFESPLEACCVVNYRRCAWQDERGALRVTLDRGLSFFALPPDLWTRDFALVRETLGEPVGRDPNHVLEIKARGQLPAWLVQLLGELIPAASGYSKFVAACQSLRQHKPAT